MYSAVLSAGAYTLLLSSVIAIVVLLRKQFKQWINTSLYILSISDILFSILTSSVLLLNYVKNTTYAHHDKWNNIYSLSNGTWNQDNNNERDWKVIFTKFNESFNAIINQNNLNTTHECNIMNLMTNYGMFFFPFTNSFVSLLIFSVQCNLNICRFKKQCFKFFESQECQHDKATHNVETCEEPAETDCELKSHKIHFDSKLNIVEYKNFPGSKNNKERFLRFLKSDEIMRDNKKITSIFVISQWIIPIFVTGLLYLAKYDEKNYIKNIEDTECLMANNFLFNDYYNDFKPIHMAEATDSEVYTIPLNKDYISNKDLTKSPTLNDTEVNEIISKVQMIVSSLLNDTHRTSENIGHIIFDNNSKLTNITKYLEVDTFTRITKHNNSVANIKINSTEDAIMTQYENSYNLMDFQNNTDLVTNGQAENDTNEYDAEVLLFNYDTTNSSKDTIQKENSSNNEMNANATKKLIYDEVHTDISTQTPTSADENEGETTQYTIPVMSNDQMYANILMRIRNITIHNKLGNHYQNKHQYNKKQPKYKKLEQVFQHNSTTDEQNIPPIIKLILHQNSNTSKIIPLYIIDRCFISIQFLKLHLLVLIFIIYFLSILLSSILHQHGKLICQITLDKLKSENKTLPKTFDANFSKEDDNISFSGSVDSEGVSIPRLNTKHAETNLYGESNKHLNTLEGTEICGKDCKKNYNVQYKNNDRYNALNDDNEMHLNMTQQMENILKLFDIIKMSLLCGTLLWTPMISEVLFKVFRVLYVPEWLLNITYLSTIAFGVLRNVFNAKMIKLQETNSSVPKTNSIHPIK